MSEDQVRLRPGEQIVFRDRQSIGRTLRTMLLLGVVGAVISPLFTWLAEETVTALVVITNCVRDASLMGVVGFLLIYQRAEVILTGERLMYASGLLFRRRREFAISDIRQVTTTGSGFVPLEVELGNGKRFQIASFPGLDRLRETLSTATGAS